MLTTIFAVATFVFFVAVVADVLTTVANSGVYA
jgi:hypothetical protein